MAKIKVSAVQTAPVYGDVEKTVAKAVDLIAEAAKNGAQLIAFPEVFVACFPYWAFIFPPIDHSKAFKEFYKAAIDIPGPQLEKLCAAAKKHGIVVVIGVNERKPKLNGTLFNTNLIINADGTLAGKHSKLVPTYAERLVWAKGDGSSMRVFETAVGRVGTLNCGENTNTLARFSLLAQGEQIHIANFPAWPFREFYEEVEAIRIRCAAHAFEGKIFVISSTSAMDKYSLNQICKNAPEKKKLFKGKNYALTAVWGPDGTYLCDPLIDKEGIVYAEIDLDDLIAPKIMQDITGVYNDFHVFKLVVDQSETKPLYFDPEEAKPKPWKSPDAGTKAPRRGR